MFPHSLWSIRSRAICGIGIIPVSRFLKELLQNADDAEARHFRIDALPGWPTATNPLLQGPGLLVVNDGTFSEQDKHDIVSFGESGKATDSAAIGKFGIGQKAVFHLCDAFVVHAYGNSEPFTVVVNPFLNLVVDGNVTRDWESLSCADQEYLQDDVSVDFPDQGPRSLVAVSPTRAATRTRHGLFQRLPVRISRGRRSDQARRSADALDYAPTRRVH